jgi:tetratricopeptide (TPR) repeat protein
MLNTRTVTCAYCTCMVVCLLATGHAPGPDRNISVAKLPESILQSELCEATVSWLGTRSDTDGAKCDALAKSLLARDQLESFSYFVAAQSAWWRGQPKVAIARLNKLIENYGSEKAFGLRLPVGVVARLWIATMARYSGSTELATSTYEKVLDMLATDLPNADPGRKADARVVCYLYMAEIEANHRGNRTKAIAHLRAAEAAGVDPNAVDGFYGSWARYERVKATADKAQANHQLSGDSWLWAMPYAMSVHFMLTGLAVSPLADCCGPGTRLQLIGDAIHKQVLESDVSAADKMALRLLSGFYYELKEDRPEAAKQYMELFEEDSFVSACAGLHAAQAMKAQGRAKEAKSVLEGVSARYPQLESFAEKLDRLEK